MSKLDKNLSERKEEIIDEAINWIQSNKDIDSESTPPIINNFLSIELVEGLMGITVFTSLAILCCCILLYNLNRIFGFIHSNHKKSIKPLNHNEKEFHAGLVFIFSLLLLIFFIASSFAWYHFLYVLNSPKLFLLNNLQTLL